MSARPEYQIAYSDPMNTVFRNTRPDSRKSLWTAPVLKGEAAMASWVLYPAKDCRLTLQEFTLRGQSTGYVLRGRQWAVGFVPIRFGSEHHLYKHGPKDFCGKAPGLFPDVLMSASTVPAMGRAANPIFVRLNVPVDAPADVYEGKIGFALNGRKQEIPARVEVIEKVLPAAQTLHVTNWVSIPHICDRYGVQAYSEEFWPVFVKFVKDLAEHRQNMIYTPIFELVKVIVPEGRTAATFMGDETCVDFQYDYSLLDRWVETVVRNGVDQIEGQHLLSRPADVSPYFGQMFTPRFNIYDTRGKVVNIAFRMPLGWPVARAFLSNFLGKLYEHLKEKGHWHRYYQHVSDEPTPKEAPEWKKAAALVKKAMPGVRILDAFCDASCGKAVGNLLDYWIPTSYSYWENFDYFEERKRQGQEFWFYTCCGPRGAFANRFIDFPLIKTRILHWMNYRFDLKGYLHWGYNFWKPKDPYTDVEPIHEGDNPFLPPGDAWIVYPGPKGPESSLRFEMMLKGIEDYELLRLLEKKDPSKARQLGLTAVPDFTGYVRDVRAFNRLRAELIKAL